MRRRGSDMWVDAAVLLQHPSAVARAFSDESAAMCAAAVQRNWEHPVRAVSQPAPALRDLLLDIEDARCAARGTAAVCHDARLARITVAVAADDAESARSAMFEAIECLVPRVGAAEVARKSPALIVRLIEELAAPGESRLRAYLQFKFPLVASRR